MASNRSALSAQSIVNHASQSLPPAQTDKPAVKDQYAAIALFCHSCMIAAGFRLVGLGEDHRIEPSSMQQEIPPLPHEWDASATYAFRYKHAQSSMEYLLKVNRLGSKAVIMGVGLGDDKTAQLEVKVQDYISENSVKEVEAGSEQVHTQLKNVFISQGRIEDLASLFSTQIIDRLAPGIRKEGYEATASTQRTATERDDRRGPPLRPEIDQQPRRDPLRDDRPEPARPYPFHDPLAMPRPRPVPDFAPPGFEDEHELQRPGRGFIDGGRTPFGNIGERDLYPQGLGPNDPFRMGPGGGGGIRGGGGMHPTFDDPIFGDRGGQPAFDPRVPPGARYDPMGPGDGPPNGASDGPRMPGRGGGGYGGFGAPPNPFGGFGGGSFI